MELYGNWYSTKYTGFFVKGTIKMILPMSIENFDDFEKLNNKDINIEIKYTGNYKCGQINNFKTKIIIDDKNPKKILMSIPYDSGMLYSKGTLTYDIEIKNSKLIEGKYNLTYPIDNGLVKIELENDGSETYYETNWCIIV